MIDCPGCERRREWLVAKMEALRAYWSKTEMELTPAQKRILAHVANESKVSDGAILKVFAALRKLELDKLATLFMIDVMGGEAVAPPTGDGVAEAETFYGSVATGESPHD